jgi:hypothetical protein
MTRRELEWLKDVVRPTALAIRRELLRTVRSEKAGHWKLRASRGPAWPSSMRKASRHFERGFFRGLKHAETIIARTLEPKKFAVKERKRP